MNHPSLRFDVASAEELAKAFETIVSLLLEVFDDSQEAAGDVSLFAAGLAQFSEVLKRAQFQQGDDQDSALTAAEITELGRYGFELMEGLRARLAGNDVDALDTALEQLQIPLALWIVRHGGEWIEWEALTNALAQQANRLRELQRLRRLSELMGELIDAAPPSLRADLERLDPSRPWRVLHLNRAIVATRALDVEAMESAFDALLARLPEEAETFFDQGTQRAHQMGAPDFVLDCFERHKRRVPRHTSH